jgi:hypothetical protein
MVKQIIQMRISLDYIEPEIWRRFIVDSSFTLDKLHQVIQIVMGWTNTHLYSFEIDKVNYDLPDPDDEELFDSIGKGPKRENSKKVKLQNLNLRPRQKFHYTYDFGDNWEHTVLVENIYEATDEVLIPFCIAGKRNCPLEDCGSFPGYEQILKVLKKAETEDDKELLAWVGEEYDPEFFDLADTNAALNPKKRKVPKLKLVMGGGKKA